MTILAYAEAPFRLPQVHLDVNEMQFARDDADAAIEKYNQHIEKCNRAIDDLDGRQQEVVIWQQKYEEVARLLRSPQQIGRNCRLVVYESPGVHEAIGSATS